MQSVIRYLTGHEITSLLMMALNEEEKKPLLGEEDESDVKVVEDSYGANDRNVQETEEKDKSWFQRNKQKIPGYGMLALLKQVILLTMLYVASCHP